MTQIVSVQVLRGLAALSVAYGHAAHDAIQIAARTGRAIEPAYRELSAAGVDLFFVISGFVMVWSSRAMFGSPGAGRVFLTRRLARIVPLYWATTTVFLVAMVILPAAMNAPMPGPGEILKSYLFVPFQRADDGSLMPIYRLGWTLNYEMFFYACFAALLWLPARLAILALAIGFSALVAIGAWAGPQTVPLLFWSQPIILEFVLGAILGLAYLSGVRISMASGLIIATVAVAWFAFATGGKLPQGPFERLTALGGPAALLMAGCVLSRPAKGGGRLRDSLVLLGDASYALYLIHPIVIRAINVLWSRSGLNDPVGGFAFIAVSLMTSIVASVLVYRLFEQPVTGWLQAAMRPRSE